MAGSGVGIQGGTVLDPRSLDELGTDRFVETAGAGLSAGFTSAWQENISSILGRVVTRGDTSGEAANHWAGYQDPAGRGPSQDTLDMERERGDRPNTTVLTPEAANDQFKLPGLKFDTSIGADAAQSIYDTHREKMARDDIERRVGGGVAYTAARLGVGFLAGLLDPLNLASAVVPVVPEGLVAARLAAQASFAGRAAVRAGAGAVEGAVGQAMLEPGMVALNRAELNDYGMADSLQNIMFGAALGGMLHVGTGAIRDWRMPPEDVKAIVQASVAQMLDGKPVDITSLVDFAQARRAAEGITTWYDRWQRRLEGDAEQSRLARQGDALNAERIPDRARALAEAEDRLTALRADAENLRGEVTAATRSAETLRAADHVAALDQSTQDRLGDIQAELGRVIPRARRAALEAEHTSIIEGVRPTRPDAGNLEAARSEAQAQGLTSALTRVEGDAAAQEAALAKMRAADAAATAREQARREARDARTRIHQAVRDGQQDIVETAMRDQLRRFARQAGVDVPVDEARQIAKELAAASRSEFPQALALALNDMVARGTEPTFRPAREALRGATFRGMDTLGREADAAAERVGQQAVRPGEGGTITQALKAAQDGAPVKEGAGAGEAVREAQALLDEAKVAYDVEVKSGRLTEDAATAKELADVDARVKMADAEAEAAACVAKGIV